MVSSTEDALEFLCNSHFHRFIWLPETNEHRRLRVSFATTTNFDNRTLPVILFCGPLFPSRYHCLDFDYSARLAGVRVIAVDRPGMGGSTPVPLNTRIPIWLETVPLLLETLQVETVNLMCHSSGTMYLLNTLYRLRHILNPENPYVGIVAPWVENDLSRATLMNVVTKLPNSLVESFGSVLKFAHASVMPAGMWSGGLFTALAGLCTSPAGDANTAEVTDTYGVHHDVASEISRLLVKFLANEPMDGVGQEALNCLKRPGTDWGVADNYKSYVRSLALKESERPPSSQSKLKVRTYFAETDAMIGKKGQRYFIECWHQDGIVEYVDFESVDLERTNHDTALIDTTHGAMRRIFDEVAKLSS